MKNILKQILNGMGVGVGIGVIVVLYYVVSWVFLYSDHFDYVEEIDTDDSIELTPDLSVSDQEAMNILAGHWHGSTWNEDSGVLYEYDWHGNQDGSYHLDFNYINKRLPTGMDACDGIWWIKQPYFYTKCTHDQEYTYKILYLSDNYIVYQPLLSNSRPVRTKTIYVKQRVSDMKE